MSEDPTKSKFSRIMYNPYFVQYASDNPDPLTSNPNDVSLTIPEIELIIRHLANYGTNWGEMYDPKIAEADDKIIDKLRRILEE
jgi:hypothetical protein